ncbi:insulin-like growth factor-binding protein complex acid labile subunit [Armigeres subalbatus]|uniref:insulin-like growth factor-binding protein complex acid labile subunit n=1 Tax=Armigeres subalbatus TaxID=124917 RepID=UPI002ECFCB26
MQQIFIFAYILIASVSQIYAGQWKCKSPAENRNRFLQKLNRDEFQRNNFSAEHQQRLEVLLAQKQSTSVEPWMQDHFQDVEELFLNSANLTAFYIFPTLRKLFLLCSNVGEIMLNNGDDHRLEALVFKGTNFSFPTTIRVLKNLKSVDISSTVLPIVNFSIFNDLTNLAMIRFEKCQIDSILIPTNINLPNLTTLHLESNELKSVPENIERLGNLRELILRSNRITSLKVEIFDGLKELRKLRLDGNWLLQMASPVADNIQNIRRLFLQYFSPTALDLGSCLPHLEKLQITKITPKEDTNTGDSLPHKVYSNLVYFYRFTGSNETWLCLIFDCYPAHLGEEYTKTCDLECALHSKNRKN